jgi:hypothetical protein
MTRSLETISRQAKMKDISVSAKSVFGATKSKSTLLIFALAASTYAAGMVFNFIMSSVFPGVSFETDRELLFVHAGKLPLITLNVGATKIKKGDIVRVIYQDGRVYDFETTAQCSATAVCPLSYPTLKSSATAPANVSNYARQQARESKDTCAQDARRNINTGYWGSKVSERPPLSDGTQVFVHVEAWVSTGIQTIVVGGTGGCK